MSIRVLHIALTPLAGSPLRIVNALNHHTDVRARLLVLNPAAYGSRTFASDLIWKRDRDESLALLTNVDIVHLHHFFDLENSPLEINLRTFCGSRTRFIRQFHSTPLTIARGDTLKAEKIVRSEIPQLVISQYPERFFPKARLVPNIVPLEDSDYLPSVVDDSLEPVVYFAPSRDEPAWSVQASRSRWDTKGAKETETLLRAVITGCCKGKLIVRRDIPHDQCLREKQGSDIVIDEMITGSFHLSSLEGLAQGLPTFAFLDARTLDTLSDITSTLQQPWLNFRLEESAVPLRELIEDDILRKEIGAYSRQWMEKHYNDRGMAMHYVRAYQDLLEHPDEFDKLRFDPSSRRVAWLTCRRDDFVWECRRKRFGECTGSSDQLTINKTSKIMELARRVKAGLRSLADESGEFTREAMIALQNRSIALEKTLEFVASDETNRWLYVNRQERMDATATIFERSRRDFHIERYRFASERVSGRRTLDCASGTGYGVRILVEIGRAASSIGVEIDNEAVEYASKRHHIQGATFICASGDRMPLPNGCVDVITSFETVEHVPDDEALILEFRRVLRSEGLLFISTPNQWPVEVSPFHLREYDKDSFLSVLSRGFECVELYNQNSGSQTPYNHNQAAGIVPTTPENEHLAECYLAVCRRRA